MLKKIFLLLIPLIIFIISLVTFVNHDDKRDIDKINFTIKRGLSSNNTAEINLEAEDEIEFFDPGDLDITTTNFQENQRLFEGQEPSIRLELTSPIYESQNIIEGVEINFKVSSFENGIQLLSDSGETMNISLIKDYFKDSFCVDSIENRNGLYFSKVEDKYYFYNNVYQEDSSEYKNTYQNIYGSKGEYDVCVTSNKKTISIDGSNYYYSINTDTRSDVFDKIINQIFKL